MNTKLKPKTKTNPWLNTIQRFLLVSAMAIERPPRYPIYAGTREKTQGERNEANPARNANPKEFLSNDTSCNLNQKISTT
jgi:hypothetical protein